MSNPLRERVLGDRGFSNTPADTSPPEQQIAALKGEVLKLRKLRNQQQAYDKKVKNVEYVKIVDEITELRKVNRELKREADKTKQEANKISALVEGLNTSNSQLKGENEQLRKEIKELKESRE